jgi:hypothetical protein
VVMTLNLRLECPSFRILKPLGPLFLNFIFEVLSKAIDFYRYVLYFYFKLVMRDSQ